MGGARPWGAMVLGLVAVLGGRPAGGRAVETACTPALVSGPVGVRVSVPAGNPGEGRSLRLTLETAARLDARGPCRHRGGEAGSLPAWEGAGLYDALGLAWGFEAAAEGLRASALVGLERLRVEVAGRSTEGAPGPWLASRRVESAFSGSGLGTSVRMVVEHRGPRWTVGAGTLLAHVPASGPAQHAVTYEGLRTSTWTWSGRGRHVRQSAALYAFSSARQGSTSWGAYLYGGEGRAVFDFASESSVVGGAATRSGPGLWATVSEAVRAAGVGVLARWRPAEAVSVEAALGPVWASRQASTVTVIGGAPGSGGSTHAVHPADGDGARPGHSLYLAVRFAPAGRLALGLSVSRVDVGLGGEDEAAGPVAQTPLAWEQGLRRVWLAVPGPRSMVALPADGRLCWTLTASLSL